MEEIWPPPAAAAVVPIENIEPAPMPLPEEVSPDPVIASIPELNSSVPLQPLTELPAGDEDLTPPSLFQTPAPNLPSEPIPIPDTVLQSMHAADDLPDDWPELPNWPEQLVQNKSDVGEPHAERVHWAYWLALASGIIMLAVSFISRSFR